MRNLRKTLALVLVLVLALGTVVTAGAAFADVPSDYEYADEIDVLAALGVLTGDVTGNYRPEDSITRAEAAAVIYRTFTGSNDGAASFKGATKFPDVSSTHWANGYINWCTEMGIINGKPGGIYDPEAPVTYAEFVAMLVRGLGIENATTKYEFPYGYLAVAQTERSRRTWLLPLLSRPTEALLRRLPTMPSSTPDTSELWATMRIPFM
jgi:hypothetical protein